MIGVRRAAPHGIGRHRALDDQKVGAPVAEGKHESQAKHEAEPVHSHWIVVRGTQMAVKGRQRLGLISMFKRKSVKPVHQPLPAADVLEPKQGQRQEPEHDEKELQYFVVDRRGQAAEERVDQNDQRGNNQAEVEIPSEQNLQKSRQCVHRDSRGHDGHEREAEGIESARLFVEAELEVFRHRSRLGAIIERDHEHAEEDHRGDGSEPIEMRREDSVLSAACAHSDHFLCTEIGRYERKAGDPGRNGSSGHEEIAAGFDVPFKDDADSQDEREINDENEVINFAEIKQMAAIRE